MLRENITTLTGTRLACPRRVNIKLNTETISNLWLVFGVAKSMEIKEQFVDCFFQMKCSFHCECSILPISIMAWFLNKLKNTLLLLLLLQYYNIIYTQALTFTQA
jgi:hypothetical protein